MALIKIPGLTDFLARCEAEERRKDAVLQEAAGRLAPMIPDMDPKRLRSDMASLHPFFGIPLEDTPDGIEAASVAKENLEEVAAAARLLASRLKALGPGAITVMHRCLGPSSEERHEADLGSLPDTTPSYMDQAEYDEWQRGGAWVVRLEALAEVASHGARRIGKRFPKGCGRRTLGQAIHGSPRKALVESCAEYLTEHGADLRKSLLLMAGALHEVKTGQKPNSTFRKEVSALLKIPLS